MRTSWLLASRITSRRPGDERETQPCMWRCARAVASRSDAERAIRDTVGARPVNNGYSWAFIGKIIGTSGEAARQRYGHKRGV